jgi:hypothetical protein
MGYVLLGTLTPVLVDVISKIGGSSQHTSCECRLVKNVVARTGETKLVSHRSKLLCHLLDDERPTLIKPFWLKAMLIPVSDRRPPPPIGC